MSPAEAFERCLQSGGVAVFPADTVYGLACDPHNDAAVERLYRLKHRSLDKPSAVMFFGLEQAFAAVPELGERTREGMRALLPGGVTVLVPNPRRRFRLACGDDPLTLGLRVPALDLLSEVRGPALQSSANLAGGPDPTRLADVPGVLRGAADLVLDGGELPGTPSTVVDLRRYEDTGEWEILRAGAVPEDILREALGWQYHFDPEGYVEMIKADVPAYEEMEDALAAASGLGARRILELGTGTGETARRLLERHVEATLVGIDVSAQMLAAARAALPGERVELAVSRLEDPLPAGPFELVASALCVHHLKGRAKAELFARIAAVLAPGGRFVLADVVEPDDPSVPRTPWTPGYDHPSPLEDQLAWLREAGFAPSVSWGSGDLVVVTADAG